MKIVFLILLSILLTIPSLSQSFDIGVAGVYGNDIKELGLNIRGDYLFDHVFSELRENTFSLGLFYGLSSKQEETE